MCTVSYIPQKADGGFVLTANRDEKFFRPTIPPQIYRMGETNVCFPKDEKAGGSWIAASDHGRLCCLLNGAFVPHQKKSFYAQSRGTVLIELASSNLKPLDFFQKKNLTNIEPLTIITLEMQAGGTSHFSEFIWDGSKKHFRELNPDEPSIWSSVTLYSAENRKLRRQWFDRFLKNRNGDLSPEQIFEFHLGRHTDDGSINVVMERNGGLKTVSITQVVPEKGKFRMAYFDLGKQLSKEVTT